MNYQIKPRTTFITKITLLIVVLFSSFNYTKATTYEYIMSNGGATEATVKAGLDAACGGDCEGGDVGDDTLRIIIQDGIDVTVSPNEADWNLTEYSVIVIEIEGEDGVGSGGGSLFVPKKSEILLSVASHVIINPNNTDGLTAGNNGNTVINIGFTSFHGNVFSEIIAQGGADSGGFGTPLPIELYYFKALSKEGAVSLSWATLIEKDNNYFEIQRSEDAVTFVTIAEVAGAGSSEGLIEYMHTDIPSSTNGYVYYRLKQVDFDGKSETFDIVAVQLKGDAGSNEGFSVYPNPAVNSIQVFSSEEATERFTYTISNINGGSGISGAADWSETIDVSELSRGVYRLVVNNSSVQKLVVK